MNRRFEQAFTEQAKKLFSLYGAYMDCKRSAEDFKQGKGISLKPVKETIDELEKKSQMLAGQFVEAYNVFNFDLHQIWEEITTNLDEPMSDQQRERYCYSLITPFEAYNNNYRTFTGEELSTLDEIEKCLLELQTIISQYANMLDGAFVMFGLDLKQLQKKCGMELKRYWGGDVAMSMRAFDISKYVGTMTLAQEYLSRLPEPEEQTQEATNTDSLAVEQQEPQQTVEGQKEKPKRGRPTEPFASKMIDDADGEKLKKMHTILKGKKGKDFALIIWACIKRGWCNKPTYTQVKEEFGDIGSNTGYNRYLNNNTMFTPEEKDGALNSLD